jgi:lipopolysaccharide transport system permease protein
MVIHPLTQVAIFALILSQLLAAKLPGVEGTHAYPLYLMAGTLAWNLFVEIITRCLNLFIEQANLLKKIRFPRIALPTIVVGICLINNLLLFFSILGIFAIMGHWPGLEVLWIPVLMVPLILLSTGLGLILGIINVFVRDVGQVVPVILQILFWFTPIVYPIATIPERYQEWLRFNPIYPVVHAYQEILVYGRMPHDFEILGVTLLGVLLVLLGLFLFRRASPELVDVI